MRLPSTGGLPGQVQRYVGAGPSGRVYTCLPPIMEGGREVLQVRGTPSKSSGPGQVQQCVGRVLSGGLAPAGHLTPGPLGCEVLKRRLLRFGGLPGQVQRVWAQVPARTCTC